MESIRKKANGKRRPPNPVSYPRTLRHPSSPTRSPPSPLGGLTQENPESYRWGSFQIKLDTSGWVQLCPVQACSPSLIPSTKLPPALLTPLPHFSRGLGRNNHFLLPDLLLGLPHWLRWGRIRLQCGRPGLITGSGRSPGGGHGNPLQYSCLENPMDRRAFATMGSDMTEQLSMTQICNRKTNPDLSFCVSLSRQATPASSTLGPVQWFTRMLHLENFQI